MAAMEATWWLNDHLESWLGEKNAADTLTQSVPHNVTSEMGLALLDVADAIRPHADVVAFLQRVVDEARGRRLPRRTGRAARRTGSARRHPALPRRIRHALRGRDRHHQNALERASRHARCPRSSATSRTSSRALANAASHRGFPEARQKEQELLDATAPLPDGERKAERDQADDRPRPHLRRVPGVPEVRHGQPLLRVQAGVAARSRTPRPDRRAARAGGHLLPPAR